MELKQFLTIANQDERQKIADSAKITLSYLMTLRYRKCSPTTALKLQAACKQLAKGHKLLRPIKGTEVTTDPAAFDSLCKVVKAA